MTICIGVKVNDGLVFVADSATSMMQGAGGSITRVYNNADKVFNLHRNLPVVAMTCGLGNFGSESISTIVKGVRVFLMDENNLDPQDYTVEQIVKVCHDAFRKKFDELEPVVRNTNSFEFFVGGYSSNGGNSELWKFQFSQGQFSDPVLLAGQDFCTIIWAGQPEACVRLILGHSSNTYDVLRAANLTHEQAENLVISLRRNAQAPFLENSMPIKDAIELAEFLAQTSASFVRFLPGADTVGGDLDIATVTKYEGFRWIRRKHFYPQELNRETNHVR